MLPAICHMCGESQKASSEGASCMEASTAVLTAAPRRSLESPEASSVKR
jgi:hypothetical protein